LEASSKLNVLRQLMVALRFESDRVVVVSGYTRTLDMVQHMCAAETITCCRLDGKTPTDQRLNLVRSFNQGFAGKVIIIIIIKIIRMIKILVVVIIIISVRRLRHSHDVNATYKRLYKRLRPEFK